MRSDAPLAKGLGRLFVYGTLREGHAAHGMIWGHIVRSEAATTNGSIFAFSEGYPGLLDGPGVVVGELVTLDRVDEAFELIDAYEGDDFRRVVKEARTSSGVTVPAWCYVLAHPALSREAVPIVHGDWLRYSRDGT